MAPDDVVGTTGQDHALPAGLPSAAAVVGTLELP